MTKPKTNAERKREHDQRKRDAGFVHAQFWIKPEWRERIKNHLEKLEREK